MQPRRRRSRGGCITRSHRVYHESKKERGCAVADDPTAVEAPKVPEVAQAAPAQATTEPPPPAPPPAPRMTEAEFVAEQLALVKRGEDSNLNPYAIITRVIFKRGVGWLDGVLANVEASLGSTAGKKG